MGSLALHVRYRKDALEGLMTPLSEVKACEAKALREPGGRFRMKKLGAFARNYW